MSERYQKYLPDLVRGFREFRKLDEIESTILEEEAEAKKIVEENQWISTASRDGLIRRVEMMKLLEIPEDTELLREIVLYYWQNHSPYTYEHLLEWLDRYCGQDKYVATLDCNAYTLQLLLKLSIKEKKVYLFQRLREVVPANIWIGMQLDFNTHGKLKPYTHGRLKKDTIRHCDMKEHDFTSEFLN